MYRHLVCLIVFFLVVGATERGEAKATPWDKRTAITVPPSAQHFKVVLMLGHSNMSGRADRRHTHRYARAWQYRWEDGRWELAADNGTGRAKGKGGPHMPLIQKLLGQADKDCHIGVLRLGVSQATVHNTFGPNKSAYRQFIQAAKRIQVHSEIVCALTMLGGNEAKGKKPEDEAISREVGNAMSNLIGRIRRDLMLPALPVVITPIGDRDPAKMPHREIVNAQLAETAKSDPHVYRVSANKLRYEGSAHYTAQGYKDWADRVAQLIRPLKLFTLDEDTVLSSMRSIRPSPKLFSLPGTGSRLSRSNPVDRVVLRAEATEAGQALTLEDIRPYKHGLTVTTYRVLEGPSSKKDFPSSINVVSWSIKQRKRLTGAKQGKQYRLALEPWEQRTDLHDIFLRDDSDSFDAPYYFEVKRSPL